jgi:hypothetical protein
MRGAGERWHEVWPPVCYIPTRDAGAPDEAF